MKELKRSDYRNMKAAVIASRDQLCINSKLRNKSNIDKLHKCKAMVKSNECKYYEKVHSSLREPEICDAPILDVEELGHIGRKLECCSYYVSKGIAEKAEILFLPYNYLLDPRIRQANQISLENAIIILDEAHNVEKVCEESASTSIASTQIQIALRDINKVIQNFLIFVTKYFEIFFLFLTSILTRNV